MNFMHPIRSSLRASAPAALALLLTAGASAQTGTLDQESPLPQAGCVSVGFSSSVGLVWRNQVRAGMDGVLEGVDVYMYGFTNTSINVRIRLGDAPNAGPILFEDTALYTGLPSIYIDTSAAGVALQAGDLFVIELEGDGSLAGISGSTCNPPAYAEPLYLNGAPFSQPTYRQAFRTWMLDSVVGTEFCFGSGCPCGNDDPSAGCANSSGTGGHLEVASGSASILADDLELNATGLPTGVNGIVFMGSTQQSTPFGDGIRCAGSPTVRFGVQSSGPDGSMNLQGPAGLKPSFITAGTTWNFQTWYRDPTGPCGNSTNMSNAVAVTFAP